MAGRLESGDVARMATAAVSRSEPQDAQRLVRRLEAASLGHPAIAPTLGTYGALVHLLHRAGSVDGSLAVVQGLRANPGGPQPDIAMYSPVTNSLVKAGRITEAANLLRAMLDDPTAPLPETRPTLAVLSALAKANRGRDALEVLKRMLGRPERALPDIRAYVHVISAFLGRAADTQADRDAVPHVLNLAVEHGVMRRDKEFDLGFSSRLDELNLHRGCVQVRSDRPNGGVPGDVAKALFDYHWGMGNIRDGTQIVVGHHGTGALREAMAERLREKGWYHSDVLMVGLDEAPRPLLPEHINRGRMRVCDPRQ